MKGILHVSLLVERIQLTLAFKPQAADEYRQLQREGEELNNQMEEDTDQEILALKTHYERQLRQQTDENIKLRGDTGILRKKVISHMSSVCTVHVYIYMYYIIIHCIWYLSVYVACIM